MRLIKILKHSSEQTHWLDALLWLGWAVACGLLPLWATILFLKLYKQNVNLASLTYDGAFFIYAASYLGSSLYIVIKDFKQRGFPNKGLISLIMSMLLLMSTLAFAQISVSTILNSVGIVQPLTLLDKNLVSILSWVLLPFVLFLSYIVTVIDNVRVSVDLMSSKKGEMKELDKQFDELEDSAND